MKIKKICFYFPIDFEDLSLARISHTNERKGKQDVMSDFENCEEANMKIHIGDERF